MTKRQKRTQRQHAPKSKPLPIGQHSKRESYLLAELKKVGYSINQFGPFQFYITKTRAT